MTFFCKTNSETCCSIFYLQRGKRFPAWSGEAEFQSFLNTDSNVFTLEIERERVEVRKALEAQPTKIGTYKAWTANDHTEIKKYAYFHENAATIHHFATRHLGLKR